MNRLRLYILSLFIGLAAFTAPVQAQPHATQHRYYAGIDKTALAHYVRVKNDGGTVPGGLATLNEAVKNLKTTYNDSLPQKLAAAIDPHVFGYKPGSGTGTTAGCAAQKCYSLMGASSDVVQTTAASQPLLLEWNEGDGNYLFIPLNMNDNNATTPSTVSNDITGDVDIDGLANWDVGTVYLCDRRATNQQFTFFINSASNRLSFSFYNGVTNETASSTVNPGTGLKYFRAKRIASTGNITFYTSTNGTTWTQLGTVVSSTAGALSSEVSPIRVGSTGSGVGSGNGYIYSMRLYNGDRESGGTLVSNFLASDYDISVSQNTLTSSTTGEVWTINRSTATTGYKAQLVYRTTMQGDAVNDEIWSSSYTLPQPYTSYQMFDEMGWTANAQIITYKLNGSYVAAQSGTSPNVVASGGSNISYNGESLNNLLLYSAQLDSSNSILGVNDVYSAPQTTGSNGIDFIRLFGSGTYSNAIINTLLVAKQADNSTTRTATYNLIRAWNGF